MSGINIVLMQMGGAERGAPEPSTAEEVASDFPSQGGPNLAREQVPGGPLLMAAYIVMWVLVFAFVVALVRRQRQLARDVARLEAKLDARIASARTARRSGE